MLFDKSKKLFELGNIYGHIHVYNIFLETHSRIIYNYNINNKHFILKQIPEWADIHAYNCVKKYFKRKNNEKFYYDYFKKKSLEDKI